MSGAWGVGASVGLEVGIEVGDLVVPVGDNVLTVGDFVVVVGDFVVGEYVCPARVGACVVGVPVGAAVGILRLG